MDNPKDGDRINLPLGWYMELDGSTREGDDLQGFVFSPDGKESASLACAIGTGATSGDDERQIPESVLAALAQYEEKYS